MLAMLGLLNPAWGASLTIGTSANVTTLDPHYLAAQPNINIGWHVFDALTHMDDKLHLVPGLATSWQAIDPTTWEFKLRRGVKFHDGSEFTADDVAFSIDRVLGITGSPGGFASYIRAIIGKVIVDPYTIRLKTATPYGALPQELNLIQIVSKKAAAGANNAAFDSGRAMSGTGPFRFVRYTPGDRVELARNDAYWGAKPVWDKVTFRFLPSDPVRTAALLAGDVDAIENIPSADVTRLRNDTRFRIAETVSWRTIFFHLDQHRTQPPLVTDKSGKPLASNPFMDIRVRRAISKAINRQALADKVMQGLAIPTANLVSAPVYGHNTALKPEAYDPEGAKKLLTEAGYPNGFALTVAAPSDRYINDEQVAQTVAQMLARVGISTKVEAVPLSVYFPKMRNLDYSFALLGWGSYASDLALRSLVATTNANKGHGAWNWARYSNPKLDLLIERSLASVDENTREGLAREASALAYSDLALIPLYHQVATWAMKKNITYAPRTDEFTFAHHFRLQ